MAPLDHPEQDHHAEHDAGVGHVEGRPGDRVDEVDHRALAGPVGEVAERAAEQQPDRQPQPRRVAVGDEVADQQRQREPDQDRHDQRRRPPAPRTPRPCCACWSGRGPENTSTLLAGRDASRGERFVAWSTRDARAPAVASRRGAGLPTLTRLGSGWRRCRPR